MADGADQPFDPAAYLAEWTSLSPDDFKLCYKSSYPRGSARSWEELVAFAGTDLIVTACREADALGFLDRLAEIVGKWEADTGRDPAAIADMLTRSGGEGVMQAIINQAEGLLDPASLLAVYEAYAACAMVVGPNGFRGTAFLVRPDMVLTAAHVVLDCDDNGAGKIWSDRLFDELTFSFRARDGAASVERVVVRAAAKDALIAHSKPWGQWPNRLNCSLASTEHGPTFDYALIRLAQRVEHIKPVPVDPPAGVTAGNRCWAMGFPGGSAGKVDIKPVVDDKPGGGRWLHQANTVEGMSGGCCINDAGKLAGIHEGTVRLMRDGAPVRLNRGVGIAAIRSHQNGDGRDPMTSRIVVPGVEFEDVEMVGELYRAGLRLADATFAASWDSAVRAVLAGADPTYPANLPAFHPWFTRDRFEDWIRRAAPRERLCFVSGEHGAGASFCKQILKARLDPSGLDYLEISPTQVAAFSPREAIPASSATPPSPSRTGAANFRYNDANDLIKQLRGGGQYIAGARTLVIDFGPDGGPDRLIGTSWQEFITRLLAEETVRLVLIGLTPDEQTVLHDLLFDNPATQDIVTVPIRLAHVTPDEFESYVRALADARGVRLKTADLRQRLAPILGPYPYVPPGNAALQTSFFALAAMTLEAGL